MDAADVERLDAEVLADTVTLVYDVIARLDVAEMRDLLAVVAVLADCRMALVAPEDVLLRHDDEARRGHLESCEQGPPADVDGIIPKGLCRILDE